MGCVGNGVSQEREDSLKKGERGGKFGDVALISRVGRQTANTEELLESEFLQELFEISDTDGAAGVVETQQARSRAFQGFEEHLQAACIQLRLLDQLGCF